MFIKKTCIAFAVSILFFLACTPEDVEPETPPIINSIPNFQYLDLDSEYLFNQDKFHTFELILSEENLAFLDNDPSAEQYVEGKLKFEGETVSQVGIRYKGSIGSFWGCLSGDPNNGPSGYKTCLKLPMKVKINWTDSDLKFYGLKKLQFHSLNKDASQMKERLGYHLFNAAGVAAPRCVHVRLLINGELSGVYALVEQIDGRFSDHHFDNGDGNIYREIWPIKDDGSAQTVEAFERALRTNEEEADVEIISDFARDLENSNENNIKTIINKWMATDKMLTYCVIDRVLKHDDGPFHWYCNTIQCTPHNFYWYENEKTKKLQIIPWDLDAILKSYLTPFSVTGIPDDWGETSNDCEAFDYNGSLQRSAACDKLVNGLAMFESEYLEIKNEFIGLHFSKGEIDFLIEKWTAQIKDATEEAFLLHGTESLSPTDWNAAIHELQEALSLARIN